MTAAGMCDCCGLEPAVVEDESGNGSAYCIHCDHASIEADGYGKDAAICMVTEAIEAAVRYGYAHPDDILVAVHKHLAHIEAKKEMLPRSSAQLWRDSARNQRLRKAAVNGKT